MPSELQTAEIQLDLVGQEAVQQTLHALLGQEAAAEMNIPDKLSQHEPPGSPPAPGPQTSEQETSTAAQSRPDQADYLATVRDTLSALLGPAEPIRKALPSDERHPTSQGQTVAERNDDGSGPEPRQADFPDLPLAAPTRPVPDAEGDAGSGPASTNPAINDQSEVIAAINRQTTLLAQILDAIRTRPTTPTATY